MGASKRRKPLLSTSRCTGARKTTNLASSQARAIVRCHHVLTKRLSQAQAREDESAVKQISTQIEENGGLQAYQAASLAGQAVERGGDSSRILVGWIRELKSSPPSSQKLRLLEIGALKVDNTCATCHMFEVDRIDLHAQNPLIRKQDFMQMPKPLHPPQDGYDVVSLSLVLNYVGDAEGRGRMLARLSDFMRQSPACSPDPSMRHLLPALFLVLPAPCVENSRYLSEEKLREIMDVLGWEQTRRKISPKLFYSLWKFRGLDQLKPMPKRELRLGGSRNNFAITLTNSSHQFV